MMLKDIVDRLHLVVRCGGDRLDREVSGAYAGDLLSVVMANSEAGDVWITMQIHVNILAVALLKELAAIILVQGRQPTEDTLKKAVEEKVPILVSNLPAFETAGRLHEMIRGEP
jgi:hypothetical protein